MRTLKSYLIKGAFGLALAGSLAGCTTLETGADGYSCQLREGTLYATSGDKSAIRGIDERYNYIKYTKMSREEALKALDACEIAIKNLNSQSQNKPTQ